MRSSHRRHLSVGTLKQTVRFWTDGLSFQAVWILILSTVLLIVFHDNCSTSVFRTFFQHHMPHSSMENLYPAFYWYGCSFLVLGVVPLLLGRFAFNKPFGEWGIGLGDKEFGIKAVIRLYGAFLPILVLVSLLPGFQAKYPLFTEARQSVLHFLVYEAMYAIYFIGWEFIFRGFMLFGLRPHLGFYAVFVQTIPFAIMHFGKPQLETLSAVLAGILLGYLALRTRSFWYGWILHSLVAITNDFLAICHKL